MIPVKTWIKRIAGLILRSQHSPPRQVFRDVTRAAAFIRSCGRLQRRLFSNFHTVCCHSTLFLHLSSPPPSSTIGRFQSFGRFGVIWSSGAVGSRCGDKKRQGRQDCEESRLSVWPRMEGQPAEKALNKH